MHAQGCWRKQVCQMSMIHSLCPGIASSSFIRLLPEHPLTGIKHPAQEEESRDLPAEQTIFLTFTHSVSNRIHIGALKTCRNKKNIYKWLFFKVQSQIKNNKINHSLNFIC